MADNGNGNGGSGGGLATLAKALPVDRLKEEAKEAAKAMGERGLQSVQERISHASDSLTESSTNGGLLKRATAGAVGKASPDEESDEDAESGDEESDKSGGFLSGVKDKLKSAFGGGGGNSGGGRAVKSTNIVESVDVGLPLKTTYNLWTQLEDFPTFMKKVENVDQGDEVKNTWKAQVFWSHRQWEATIQEQVPDTHIIWRSKGSKGHVDGAVSFHELSPNLTRILVVLEYYPQGLFERTGNLWRAQGRRARLELKHFRRHAMVHAALETDEIEGWRGEIREGEVVKTHEDALEEEQQNEQDQDQAEDQDQAGDQPEDEYEDEYEDEGAEEGPEDEYDDEYEDEGAEEGDEEAPEDEYDEEAPEDETEDEEPADEEPADEAEEPADEPADEAEEPAAEEEQPKPRPRRRTRKES